MPRDFGLCPEPPPWALEEGLPAPYEGETFIPYVRRLGLQLRPLLKDLTQQTIVLANVRLATTLQRSMWQAFDRHVQRLADKHIAPQRQKELEVMAYNLFGARFRRRPII